MKKRFEDMPICEKGHEGALEMFCTRCETWVCGKCKEAHLDHEGQLKDFEELTNQHVQIYAEHLKSLKSFFRLLERTPADTDYDDIKQEVQTKINAAYEQLITQLCKHRDGHIKRITDYIEHAKRKRQKLEQDSKPLEICVGKLQKILNKLRKCNVSKIPKHYLVKYNNFERVKFHQDGIENVKRTIDRCTRIYEKYSRLKNLEIKAQLKDSYISKMIQIPTNLKEEPRLMLIQPASANVIVLNLETMRKRLVTLGDKTFKFPQLFEFVQTKHKIVLCGGSDEIEEFIANTYEVSVDSGSAKELAHMEVPKKYHSLCMLNGTTICSTGGLGTSGALKTCEMLDTCANEWTMVPPLSEAREGPSTCAVGGKYIYCVGGRANETTLFRSMEVLDTTFQKMGWQQILLQTEGWEPMYFGLLCPLSAKQLMICGGLDCRGKPLSRGYVIDLENDKYDVKECAGMQLADCFLERDRKLHKGKLYAIGYSSYAIHIWDTENGQWSIIKSQTSGQAEEEKKSPKAK
ncbi:MAG: B-box zinc finger protein [Candidatus Pacebacteria bacterium]|nr:B-box zinc finger protein [Candidatus Paceibacterota bacterium]